MIKKIRTIIATVVFVLITLLFLDFTGTLHHWLGWLAKIQFLPAVMALNVIVIVLLVVLTLVFGRIYCSVICPLGILQDLLARLRRKKNKYSYSGEVRWLRYPVLLVFIIAGVLGVGSLFQLLAPYSAFGRIATMIFQPLWMLGNNRRTCRQLCLLYCRCMDEVAACAYHCHSDTGGASYPRMARRPDIL